MPISKIQSSAVSAFIGNSTTVVSGTSTGYQRTITVTAGSLLTARIFVANPGASGDLISAVTDSRSQTWTRRVAKRGTEEDGFDWVYVYDCLNAAAGSTTISLDFAIEDNNNNCVWEVTEFAGAMTAGAFDTSAVAGVTGAADTLSIGPTATLAQADSMALYVMGARWWYTNTTPSGWTQDTFHDGNTYAQFQTGHKILSATTAQSASFTGLPDQSTQYGAIGAIAVYRAAGSGASKRVRVLFNTAINGDTAITALVWGGDPTTNTAQRYTGLTAEASGGVLLINLPSNTTFTAGQSVSVIAYNASDTSGLVTGTVENY